MVCDLCRGGGKITCSNCEGKGYYMDRLDYTYYACLACGGSGTSSYYSIPSILKAASKGEVKFGSGWVKCPKCNGTGLLSNDYEFLLGLIKKLIDGNKLDEEEMRILKNKYGFA